MNHSTLLMHAVIRHTYVDSPEEARRREHLYWLERETRDARRRRRRERIRRAWNALRARHGNRTDSRMRRADPANPRQALR